MEHSWGSNDSTTPFTSLSADERCEARRSLVKAIAHITEDSDGVIWSDGADIIKAWHTLIAEALLCEHDFARGVAAAPAAVFYTASTLARDRLSLLTDARAVLSASVDALSAALHHDEPSTEEHADQWILLASLALQTRPLPSCMTNLALLGPMIFSSENASRDILRLVFAAASEPRQDVLKLATSLASMAALRQWCLEAVLESQVENILSPLSLCNELVRMEAPDEPSERWFSEVIQKAVELAMIDPNTALLMQLQVFAQVTPARVQRALARTLISRAAETSNAVALLVALLIPLSVHVAHTTLLEPIISALSEEEDLQAIKTVLSTLASYLKFAKSKKGETNHLVALAQLIAERVAPAAVLALLRSHTADVTSAALVFLDASLPWHAASPLPLFIPTLISTLPRTPQLAVSLQVLGVWAKAHTAQYQAAVAGLSPPLAVALRNAVQTQTLSKAPTVAQARVADPIDFSKF